MRHAEGREDVPRTSKELRKGGQNASARRKQHLGYGRTTGHEVMRGSRYADRRTEGEKAPAPTTGRTQVLTGPYHAPSACGEQSVQQGLSAALSTAGRVPVHSAVAAQAVVAQEQFGPLARTGLRTEGVEQRMELDDVQPPTRTQELAQRSRPGRQHSAPLRLLRSRTVIGGNLVVAGPVRAGCARLLPAAVRARQRGEVGGGGRRVVRRAGPGHPQGAAGMRASRVSPPTSTGGRGVRDQHRGVPDRRGLRGRGRHVRRRVPHIGR